MIKLITKRYKSKSILLVFHQFTLVLEAISTLQASKSENFNRQNVRNFTFSIFNFNLIKFNSQQENLLQNFLNLRCLCRFRRFDLRLHLHHVVFFIAKFCLHLPSSSFDLQRQRQRCLCGHAESFVGPFESKRYCNSNCQRTTAIFSEKHRQLLPESESDFLPQQLADSCVEWRFAAISWPDPFNTLGQQNPNSWGKSLHENSKLAAHWLRQQSNHARCAEHFRAVEEFDERVFLQQYLHQQECQLAISHRFIVVRIVNQMPTDSWNVLSRRVESRILQTESQRNCVKQHCNIGWKSRRFGSESCQLNGLLKIRMINVKRWSCKQTNM